jgi:hypothetical protein
MQKIQHTFEKCWKISLGMLHEAVDQLNFLKFVPAFVRFGSILVQAIF